MPKPVIINIVIDGGQFEDPDPVHCTPGKSVRFTFHNEDQTSYDVTMDPDEIIEKQDFGQQNPVQENPFTTGGPTMITVPGMTTASIRLILKAKNKFGKGQNRLPFTTYKYTAHGAVSNGGPAINDLDPDLDITP